MSFSDIFNFKRKKEATVQPEEKSIQDLFAYRRFDDVFKRKREAEVQPKEKSIQNLFTYKVFDDVKTFLHSADARMASEKEYLDWVEGHLKRGGYISRLGEIGGQPDIVLLQKDTNIPPFYGAESLHIIVPETISVSDKDLGHNEIFYMKDFSSSTRGEYNGMGLYTDKCILDEMARRPLFAAALPLIEEILKLKQEKEIDDKKFYQDTLHNTGRRSKNKIDILNHAVDDLKKILPEDVYQELATVRDKVNEAGQAYKRDFNNSSGQEFFKLHDNQKKKWADVIKPKFAELNALLSRPVAKKGPVYDI